MRVNDIGLHPLVEWKLVAAFFETYSVAMIDTFDSLNSGLRISGGGAFDSAKNHKRQRHKRQSRNRQTRKVANAKVRIG